MELTQFSYDTLYYLLTQKKQQLENAQTTKEKIEAMHHIETINNILILKYEEENYSLRKIIYLLRNANDNTKKVFEKVFERRVCLKNELVICSEIEEVLKCLRRDTIDSIAKYAKNDIVRFYARELQMEIELKEMTCKEGGESHAKHKRK